MSKQRNLLLTFILSGLIFITPTVHAESSITMYRLYNPHSGEHFYTKNTYERDHLKSIGWHYEGTGWYAPSTGNPVYRMYNPNTGDHHYTLGAGERDHLKSIGWRYEGIGWYSDTQKKVPLYRAYNPNAKTGNHNYTTGTNEQKNLVSRGWKNEGIAWYGINAGSNSNNVVSEKLLGVQPIYQGNTMLCEGSSLLEALHYKGKATNQNLTSFVNSMPIANDYNPYHGYSGEWRYNVDGTYQGMMADPVISWAKKNGGNAVNITGSGANGIKQEIRNGNPVVTWITYNYETAQFKQMSWGRAVWNGHVVTVDGFKDSAYHVVDPVFGAKWITSSTFERSFNTTGMAVSIR